MDISQYDIHDVIRALWKNSKPAAFFETFAAIGAGACPPPMPSDSKIDELLNQRCPYIDYLNGRLIKTDFSDIKNVDFRLYDREYGQGAA